MWVWVWPVRLKMQATPIFLQHAFQSLLCTCLHIAKKFDQAMDFYSKAIDFNPTMAAYYGNRSFAHLKTESYGYALVDASKALDLDKTYIKVDISIQ